MCFAVLQLIKRVITSVKLIVKAGKDKKIQQKQKINAPLIANSKQVYTINGTIPAEESFSFRNTGK